MHRRFLRMLRPVILPYASGDSSRTWPSPVIVNCGFRAGIKFARNVCFLSLSINLPSAIYTGVKLLLDRKIHLASSLQRYFKKLRKSAFCFRGAQKIRQHCLSARQQIKFLPYHFKCKYRAYCPCG